jgi:O-succinylbenzoate synthase
MSPTLHLTEIELRFREPLVTAAGTVTARRSVLVGWDESAVIGWAEAPAFPSGRFGTAAAAWDALCDPAGWVNDLPQVPIAAAAVEAARADGAARRTGQPLHRWLGGSDRAVVARHPVGIQADAATAAVTAERLAGMGAIKLKIAPGRDIEPVAAIRRRHPELDIGVDANGTYDSPDDPVFDRLGGLGVSFIEQPFAAGDVDAHRALTGRTAMAVCLDETTDNPEILDAALRAGACDTVSIKINRHGLSTFRRLSSRCAEHGIGVRVGGTFDSSLGRRHLLAAATLPEVIDAEVGPPLAYLLEDVCDYPEPVAGRVTPDDGPGIGVDPDPEAVARLAIRSHSVHL